MLFPCHAVLNDSWITLIQHHYGRSAMKPHIALIFLASFIGSSPALVAAKDCECQKHSAGASGSGSCSLTESSSKCSISYTASVSGSSSSSSWSRSSNLESRSERDRAAAARIAANARLQIPVERAFETLNQHPPQAISLDEFRSVAIGAFAATGAPIELSSWIRRMRLEGSWGRPDFEFETLHRQFQEHGCIEFSEGKTRFLLISRFSNRNGNCRN